MFNSLLITKDYWHLVIKNQYLFNMMLPTIKKFLPLYKYLFGYPIVSAYIEEGIMKTRVKTKDENGNLSRPVWDINKASAISDLRIPMCVSDLHQSPFIPILLSSKLINSQGNCLGIPQIARNPNKICTLNEFKENFNIFTSGNKNISIFDGVNWDNMAVSGSCMPACSVKNNILMNVTNIQNGSSNIDSLENTKRYFSEYYPKETTDIDIMVNVKKTDDFIKKVDNIVNNVRKNLNLISGSNTDKKIKINCVRSLSIIVTKDYILDNMSDFSIDFVLENLNNNEVKERFFEIYFIEKIKQNKKYRKILKKK